MAPSEMIVLQPPFSFLGNIATWKLQTLRIAPVESIVTIADLVFYQKYGIAISLLIFTKPKFVHFFPNYVHKCNWQAALLVLQFLR